MIHTFIVLCSLPQALVLAKALFELITTKSHDDVYGGFPEMVNRDW